MTFRARDIFDKVVAWRFVFVLWIIHGLVAIFKFAGTSLDFSLPFVVVLCLLLIWTGFGFTLLFIDIKKVPRWVGWKDIVCKSGVRDGFFIYSFLVILFRVFIWYFRNLISGELISQVGGYLDVLKPAIDLAAYVSLEVVFLYILLNSSRMLANPAYLRRLFALLLSVLFVFGVIIVVISKTGLGVYASYKGDWQRGLPAVPLLEWQILLAAILCVGTLIFEVKRRTLDFNRIDIVMCFVIWISTSLFWLSQPVIPNPSALTPREPNYEIYPFIDSQTYDQISQSILIGNGFGGEQIPQRPLYIVFLALTHVLVGQDYSYVILVQILFFAFFPVLLFLIGRDLFGRPVGISIALLAILRDYTSNIVSPFTGNLSYSKVFLSEIPTAIFLILFLLIVIRWIKSGYPLFLGFLLGGVLGLAVLIRTQAIVALPVVLFFSILVQRGSIKFMIKSTILIVVMVIVTISPWLWRNWEITGDLIFDNPESQTMNLALRYSRVNGVDWQVARLPGETSVQFSARLQKIAFNAILSNPSGAAQALINSFVNHGINNVLLFPLRNEIRTLNDVSFPSDAFWEKWEGKPTTFQSIIIGFYVFLFSLGVTMAWMRNGWLGLLPLGLNLIYNLWTSIALLSGQRFMLTMDWSIYFYYMVGIFTLIGCFLFVLNGGRTLIVEWINANPFVSSVPFVQVDWPKFLFLGILFFAIGFSLPLAEKVFPEKYPHLSQGQLATMLAESSALQNFTNSSCVTKLIIDEQLSITQGRALYPRYYNAKDGEDFTDTPGYKAVDYGRLVFDIIGQENHRVIFPMQQSPDFFPHASDITLVSGQNGEPWFVLVSQGEDQEFYASDYFDEALCD